MTMVKVLHCVLFDDGNIWNIRIGHECEVRTDKSVPRVTILASRGSAEWCDTVTRGTDLSARTVPYTNVRFFFLHTFVPTLEFITILPKDTPHMHVSYFVLTPFSDALVTFVSDQVTWSPLQPMISTGSKQQGQNISDHDQNLGFTRIVSSGMQET